MIGGKVGIIGGSGGGGLDPLTVAFISAHETATGISMNAIQQAAIEGFVQRLRGIGTTNETDFISDFNLVAVYPYCPSDDSTASAAGYKINLLNPGTNDISYSGFVGGDFVPTGASGGSGKIANSGIDVDTLAYNDYMLSFYSRDTSASGRVMGTLNNAGNRALDPGFTAATTYANFHRGTVPLTNTITNTQGLFVDCEGSQRRNGSEYATRTNNNVTLDNNNIFLHSRNFGGAANAPSSNEFAGFAIGQTNFDANANQDWFDAWDWYQTNVITGGRNV